MNIKGNEIRELRQQVVEVEQKKYFLGNEVYKLKLELQNNSFTYAGFTYENNVQDPELFNYETGLNKEVFEYQILCFKTKT